MKFEYLITQQDDYTDISVFYDDNNGESWTMDLDRDMRTFEINGPWYLYSKSKDYTYEAVEWHDIPPHAQDYFNKHLRRAKTLLILGDNA